MNKCGICGKEVGLFERHHNDECVQHRINCAIEKAAVIADQNGAPEVGARIRMLQRTHPTLKPAA